MKQTSGKLIIAAGALAMAMTNGASAGGRDRADPDIVVYVSSQGLFYDSFVAAKTLPPKGRFQKLEMGGPHGGPMTEWGPGDRDFVGGRWWLDTNTDGVMDENDTFFSCPLMGPGRTDP
jgi:hypothetical protein